MWAFTLPECVMHVVYIVWAAVQADTTFSFAHSGVVALESHPRPPSVRVK